MSAARHVAEIFGEKPDDPPGFRWAMEHAGTNDELFAAVVMMLDHIKCDLWDGRAKYHGSAFHRGGFDWVHISVHAIGGLFFVWYVYCADCEGSGNYRYEANRRIGGFFVNYEDALEAAFNLAEAWRASEEEELARRMKIFEEQKKVAVGRDIGKEPALHVSSDWYIEELERDPWLGRGAEIVPAIIHAGHNVNRRMSPSHPLVKKICFLTPEDEERRRAAARAYIERKKRQTGW